MQLSDAQFERIAPYLPRPSGHTKVDQHEVLEALLYMAKEGCSWRTLPERFGNWHTIYARLNRWAKQGVLERVLSELQRDQIGGRDGATLSLDSTIIKLRPDASGARRRGGQAIGRSRSLPRLERGAAGRPNCTPSSPTTAPR